MRRGDLARDRRERSVGLSFELEALLRHADLVDPPAVLLRQDRPDRGEPRIARGAVLDGTLPSPVGDQPVRPDEALIEEFSRPRAGSFRDPAEGLLLEPVGDLPEQVRLVVAPRLLAEDLGVLFAELPGRHLPEPGDLRDDQAEGLRAQIHSLMADLGEKAPRA